MTDNPKLARPLPPASMHRQLLTTMHNKAVAAARDLGIPDAEIAHCLLATALHQHIGTKGKEVTAQALRDFIAAMTAEPTTADDTESAPRVFGLSILGDRISEGVAILRLTTEKDRHHFEIDAAMLESLGRTISKQMAAITANVEAGQGRPN